MNYGIYYAYWEKEWGGDFIPYIERVKRLGFDVLEVACHDFLNVEDEYLYRLKNEAEKQKIVLTGGYGPDINHNISSEKAEVVKAAFDRFEIIFQKMQKAGIKKLGGGLYSYWPVNFMLPFNKEKDLKRGIENIAELADMASEYDITLGMEVLNRYEGYMLNTAAEAIDFVSRVNRKNVKVMLDTFHMNIEEDSMGDAIRQVGDLLGHFHIGEANRRPPHGKGRIPWEEIGEALHDINYTGDVVMEPFVRMDGQIGKDIRIWHDFSNGCSNDELDKYAANAVTYLKNMWRK